ncbi:carbohydrate ABC transporter permease [Marinivivus vitaminiproducens]|uniref:carbohydrate ABC transporter permease n=1 Tax=Marinivivus vitaminiproducens TaxID=3035935 RepID=UPI0027A8CA6F|nr:carbohydrate ABC transporter permease [Geminicoccaceae bacterium SCSIO 64248]
MRRKLVRSLVAWLVLAPLIVVILFPFAVMLVTALKPAQEVLSPNWWPSEVRLSNFVEMWQATGFGAALLNSVYVALLSTFVTLLVGIPAAYAAARLPFPGQGPYRQFLLVTQMLSPIVLVIGLFRVAAGFGLLDSVSAVGLIYAAFNTAFAVWMLQSYFATIPKDLEEAAWIEGAGWFRALTSVFLPLATPAMTVTAIFTFINAWNEFVIALTLLRSQGSYTLPIQIFSLVAGRYTVEWHHIMAATLLATLPVAVVFAWLQRYLVRGLALGAVK